MDKAKKIFSMFDLEAFMWIIALSYLLFINPYAHQHFTLCPFKNLGISFCPGCGLGRSIAFLYHGDISQSFSTHPLGIAALILILHRIASLLYRSYKSNNKPMEVFND